MSDIGSLLAVDISARIGKLEREMKRATATTTREFSRIEQRSQQASARLESHMAKAGAAVRQSLSGLNKAFLGGLAAGGFAGITTAVQHLVQSTAQIGDEARRAGVGIEAFQEWKHVAEQARIPTDSMVDALKELNIRADEFATTGKGSAAEAFARLGLTPEEVQQRIKDPSAFMLELIERTRRLGDTAAGVRVFDELFGGTGGERLVALLSRSQEELRGTIQQARDLGLVLSEDLVRDAAELDRKFNLVATTVGTALKTAIVEAATALDDFLSKFQALEDRSNRALDGRLRELGLQTIELERQRILAETTIARGDGGVFDVEGALARGDLERIKEEAAAIAAEEVKILAILDGRKPATPSPTAPVAPVPLPAGRATAPRDAYAEMLANAREFIAAQELEQAALNKTASEAARLRYEHDLLNQVTRAGLDLSPAQRAEIGQLAAQMATAEQATRSLTDAQAASVEAGQFLGAGLSDAFSDIILGASSAEDAIKGMTAQLARAAIQAALMGTGPFGGMVGGKGLFSGLRLASGGEVRGPGTGTSDSIPALLSNGEHVIRASEARKHRALLEAINAGRVGRFADGGAVGAIAPLAAAAVASGPAISISAPITVAGSAGTPTQNQDLADRMARELRNTMRGIAAEEFAKQLRPGNVGNNRTR